jgi:hypothetical protein
VEVASCCTGEVGSLRAADVPIVGVDPSDEVEQFAHDIAIDCGHIAIQRNVGHQGERPAVGALRIVNVDGEVALANSGRKAAIADCTVVLEAVTRTFFLLYI